MSSPKQILHTVKARHAYTTTVADQLSFAAGDMMHIVAKNGGWWMAVKISNPTERGWAPSNYLSIVNELTGELEKVQVTPRTQAGQVRPETIAGTANIPITSTTTLNATPNVSNQEYPPTNGKPLLYAVRTLHKFTATQADGLSFDQGEILSIVGVKDGWLRAFSKDGKEGWAPSNYTKQIEGSATPTTTTSSPSEGEGDGGEGATPMKKVLGVDTSSSGLNSALAPSHSPSSSSSFPQPSPRPDVPPLDFGMTPRVEAPTPRAPELPTDAMVAMTPRGGSASGTDTPEEEYRDQVGDLLITPRMAASIGQQQEKVRAMFNFDAKKPDHLSFKKGDVMVVIKKKAGWWKVHHEGSSGKLGYIPSNYVQPLVSVPAGENPTTTILTAAGNVAVVPVEFEPTPERPLLVKASHSYKAMANNQLSFNKHDLLHVISKRKGWWKAYLVEDSEKVGYVPSNYVKVHNGGEVPKEGEGSLQSAASGNSSSASASTGSSGAVEMEEIAIALHDLDKKDPKVLVLKRDDRFLILDKQVGGGWWRCVNLATGEMALAPSNFMRTEMQPKRQPPALPAPRGTVPNQATVFVEGTYDFTAKKPSQLSYKKYDSLVILKKDGSWWKARNRMGRVGQIPFNYCKEVFPERFVALFNFQSRSSDELSLRADEIVTVQEMEQPGWWLVTNSTGSSGYAPSNHLHPLSTRIPGQVSAPATPRSAAEPMVPATPRNVDGSVRRDPPVEDSANGGSGGIETKGIGAGGELQIESGSTPAERFTGGTLIESPLASVPKDVAQIVTPQANTKVASVILPPTNILSPNATPRPEFLHEKVPIRRAPIAPISEGLSSQPPQPAAPVAAVVEPQSDSPSDPVAESSPQPAPESSPSAAAQLTQAPAAMGAAVGSKLSGFFDSILPSAQPAEPAQPSSASSLATSTSVSSASSQPHDTAVDDGPTQVEGIPSSAGSASNAAPAYAFYEGEGESSGSEGSNAVPTKVTKPVEEHKSIEIGSSADPRVKSSNTTSTGSSETGSEDMNNRGACTGTSSWSNFFGVFAACTGAKRDNTAIPKPAQEEKQG